ncbi:MAG: hypothetical protein KAT11_01370 [Phycisphaerae bacterium]|nr:hypothetical protein [Phycisphaerae bacterium]
MGIRRGTAYFGLLIGVILLVWAAVMRYPVQQSSGEGEGISQQTISISGYGIVRETARDGLGRDEGRLVRRGQEVKPTDKDAKTCYT